MGPPTVANIGLLEQCQQAGVLAKYWAGKALSLRRRLRDETPGASGQSQVGQATNNIAGQDPASTGALGQQAPAGAQPSTRCQGPLPSPKRSRGGVDQLANTGQPTKPPPTHEGVAGSPKSPATQSMGGRIEHGPSTPPESMGGQLASMDTGLEPQPMDGAWPPPSHSGGRQDPKQGPKEEEVTGEPCQGQAPSPSQTAAPGSYIRKFLGPANNTDAGKSGQADSPAHESSDGESGESGSAKQDDEGAAESESGTPDSGQFA